MAVSAGRSTPASDPSTILAVAIAAPVLPAVMNPAARPSRTIFRPTRMEESRLERTACAALSSMLIHSLACTMKMGSRGFLPAKPGVPGKAGRAEALSASRNFGRRTSSGPTRWTRTSSWRQARIAPRISGSGDRSDPMASRTMSIGMARVGSKLSYWVGDFIHTAGLGQTH